MQEQKPNSIRTVGLIVSIISGFIIFGNGMGALVITVVGREEVENPANHADLLAFIILHVVKLCLIMVVIGLLYLVGGIYIMKYQLWANKLVSILSGLLILIVWSLTIIMTLRAFRQNETEIFGFAAILTALAWSTPLVFLIWFLNKEAVKKYFS